MMIPTMGERACRQLGEVHDFVQSWEGTPTPDDIEQLKEMVREAEQLTDAAASGIACVVAMLRLGPEAQRTKRVMSEWRDVRELDAVVKLRKETKVVRLKRKGDERRQGR